MRIAPFEQVVRGFIAVMLVWATPEVYWVGIVGGIIVILWHAKKAQNTQVDKPGLNTA